MSVSDDISQTPTLITRKLYDYQKTPKYDRKEPNTNLMLKSAYEPEDEELYYSEEDLVGDPALDNYTYKYKNMYKLNEKSSVKGEELKSGLLDYLIEVDKDKKVPYSLGYVNRKNGKNEINADHRLFGDRYAKAFSNGLTKRNKCEIINLNMNRLTDTGFLSIQSNFPPGLKILDISNNISLSMTTYKLLAEYLDQPETQLQQLMLESNQTGDKPILVICNALQYNNNLKFLNISKNNVTDIGANAVSKMLVMNNKLNVLFMHWNKIRESGGVKIAKAIQMSQSLQIWDISYNNIGTLGKEHSCAKALSKAFEENRSLIHVDLSN